MAREVLVKCDKCGEPGAEGWKIITPEGAMYDLDLDQQHSKPLRDMVKIAREAAPSKVTSLSGRSGSSLDQIPWRNVPPELSGEGG